MGLLGVCVGVVGVAGVVGWFVAFGLIFRLINWGLDVDYQQYRLTISIFFVLQSYTFFLNLPRKKQIIFLK